MTQDLALDGFDAVSYFDGGPPSKGSPGHSAEWEGKTWLFTTESNRERFLSDPATYAPRFDGACAFAVSLGQQAPGSPRHAVVRDGNLYLQANAVARFLFRVIPGRSEAAHRRWRQADAGA